MTVDSEREWRGKGVGTENRVSAKGAPKICQKCHKKNFTKESFLLKNHRNVTGIGAFAVKRISESPRNYFP